MFQFLIHWVLCSFLVLDLFLSLVPSVSLSLATEHTGTGHSTVNSAKLIILTNDCMSILIYISCHSKLCELLELNYGELGVTFVEGSIVVVFDSICTV